MTDDCIIHVMTRCWHVTMWHHQRWPGGTGGQRAALLNSLFIGRKITASRGQSYGKTFNETSPCIGNYERREKYESPLFSLNGHFSSPNLRLEASQQKALTWPIRRQLPRLSTNERTEQLKTRRLLHEAKLDIYKVAESLITFPRYQDEIKST